MLKITSTLPLAAALLLVATALPAAEYHIANRDAAGLAGAIRHANASEEADVIHLAEGGLYGFAAATEGDLALPPVRGRLTIVGHGAEIRRATQDALALLQVEADAELDIDALTLAEGSRGSVRNYGTLRLSNSAIVDGTTLAESAIVQNFGHFEARATTFGYNQVAGAGRDAGIVMNYGSMRLEQCRLAGNSLSRRYPTLAAAPLINYGELMVDALSLEDNAVIDGFEGLVSAAVLNLGIGRTAAAQPAPVLRP